jgi:hypothetical protein
LGSDSVVSVLAVATEAYQALLEGHRRDPDDEELWEDLQKARAEMEVAWLEEAVRGPTKRVTREQAISRATETGLHAGYAITVHATHRHSLDLIAVPWTDDAVSPEELVSRIADAVPGAVECPWTPGPHGRRVWEIAPRLAWEIDAWSIALSVMPRCWP